MRKFFDSRRELVSSGPGSGGGGSSGFSHAGGNFIGKSFTVGRHQVTVEEIIAEGENSAAGCDAAPTPFGHALSCWSLRVFYVRAARSSHMQDESRDEAGT